MEFLKSNLWEIKKSSALQIFGGLLAITHALTFWFWLRAGKLPLLYHADPSPMCWGMLENCHWTKWISAGFMEFAFYAYGAMAALAILTFFFSRLVGFGWVLLAGLLFLKALFYVQDLRLGANIHYLLFVLNFCYLFISNKANLLRWLLISFYVASGLLKLSPNWLSGQWFIDQLHVPIKLAEWLAGITVLAEFLAPVALMFRDLRNFLIAYFVLIAYHGVMWYAGGYFEPLNMLIVLQLAALLFYEERKIEREYLYQSFIRPEPSPAWLWFGLTLFWLVQLLPYIPHHPHKLLKQTEIMMALAPIAAAEECESTTFLVYDDRLEEYDLAPPAERPLAFRCNSYLRFLDLKAACQKLQSDGKFKTLMSYFQVRGLRDKDYHTTFASEDICHPDVTYHNLIGGDDVGI